MRHNGNRAVVALVCALVLFSSRASAQSPLPPTADNERRGSPVETLEQLTGERASEPGGESEREREEEPDEIETDRDSFTPATTTVGRRRFVVESAYSFIDNRRVKETHSLPELLLRYGLTERIEARLGWNYEVGGAGNEISGPGSGEDPFATRAKLDRDTTLLYGAKIGLTKPAGWLPRSSIILQGFTPTGGSAGTSTATQLRVAYAAGWQFPNRWRFDTAIRYDTASENGERFGRWTPSAVLRIPFAERWATHAEYFGTSTVGKAINPSQHYFSTGLHCLLNPNLEVGVRVGWGLTDQSDRFFTNAGFGWRY